MDTVDSPRAGPFGLSEGDKLVHHRPVKVVQADVAEVFHPGIQVGALGLQRRGPFDVLGLGVEREVFRDILRRQ